MKKDDLGEQCLLCNIANNEIEDIHEYDRPIYNSSNFSIIPAKGQFVSGYLLLFPHRHFLNLGVMDSVLLDEYFKIKNSLNQTLLDEYGQRPIFFEHGSASCETRGGSCIDHAHLHVLPITISKVTDGMFANIDGGRIQTINTMIDYAKSEKPYFYFETSDGSMYLYNATSIPSQFGRKMITRLLGIPDQWDWEVYPYIDRMLETQGRLHARFKQDINIIK